jgi:hypothetical protein
MIGVVRGLGKGERKQPAPRLNGVQKERLERSRYV